MKKGHVIMLRYDDKSCEWMKGYIKAMGEVVDIMKHRINDDSPATAEACILTVFHINNWAGEASKFILEEIAERKNKGEICE